MTTTTTSPRPGARVRVQRFGTFLSNMVMPNIGAFIAWGLITALFIETGWVTLVGDKIGYDGGYGWVEEIGGWGAYDGQGIVGPTIVYLLPLLIGYTGGSIVYGVRGGVVGAIATMGVIVGADVPMFMGAMIMGPLGGATMKRIDALWEGKIKPGFEMLVDNFAAGIWGAVLALFGMFAIGPVVTGFSNLAEEVVDFLVERNLLPLTSVFIEPAKVLFLNNAINHGVLTPLGTAEAADEGKSLLFLLEANPGPGLGLLLAFTIFGTGLAKASAPGAALIQFVGGIHEVYFPYVLMKPRMILAVILGGMTGVTVNVLFDGGLRAPAAPGSIIAVWAQAPASSLVTVTTSVVAAAAVTFVVAAVLLKTDRTAQEGDLAAATDQMVAMKGKDSVASSLAGGRRGPIRNIVFACDAGMGSSAMGASMLRRKLQEAGITEATVVNRAIANLDDSADLVVTHRDLTERARLQAPSAWHVSVENFMDAAQYDNIAAAVARDGAGDTDGATADEPAVDEGVLTADCIRLSGSATDAASAIDEAGALLVDAGAIDEAYVASMHERERSVSTHMGNGLSIPHGTQEGKAAVRRTAMALVRYDSPVDWNGNPTEFVVAIAARGDEHLGVISQIARVFSDPEQVERLRAARSEQDVLDVLAGVTA